MTADQVAPEGPVTAGSIADAVRAVPGVAFLRPGLSALLRASARTAPARTDRTAPGVRLGHGAAGRVVSAEVEVVLHRGHRAVDVTRAVRAAVRGAARPGDTGTTAMPVTVTVTGIV
ncbi:Asp23/Gls24 family envelope stress response protein [Streptomyces subrutilus]|uniref:Asp23/Gls24 family envelope stress response protein n=1 Tax=Streptomyces subrutilus TaxID=36818 RepID=A0A5P2UTR1_9ACTN|nr:Asp23/Gls24 family envelope stress response protein [Streptomyces subrutilus]QEU81729.1 Asp23/Gls24 family envelope stress response protein [Streptomyces subrutilus]WSJ28845.1 Asp23/Gls24 family envelope stress response protein [Streptomyces subrutilus]GGZ80305.1 hypothetical protein GCM10010371_44780 [Streptomyces subrutilus]